MKKYNKVFNNKISEDTTTDTDLVLVLRKYRLRGYKASQTAIILYNSAKEAFDTTDIGPDGVDYSGVFWEGIKSTLRKIFN